LLADAPDTKQQEQSMLNMFLCKKCGKNGSLLASAHQCTACTISTYSRFALCPCCSLEQDKCQECQTDMKSGRDEAAVKEAQEARAAFIARVAVIDAEFEAALADIKDDIDAWLKVNKEAGAAYEAAMKPFQDAYQTASDTLRTLQVSGAAADSEALVSAQKAFGEAQTAVQEAARKNNGLLFDPVKAERERIGAEKLKRHEDAVRVRHQKTSRAERRVELIVGRITGHIALDAAVKEQLAQLDEQDK
jgi:hypothetical protein